MSQGATTGSCRSVGGDPVSYETLQTLRLTRRALYQGAVVWSLSGNGGTVNRGRPFGLCSVAHSRSGVDHPLPRTAHN